MTIRAVPIRLTLNILLILLGLNFLVSNSEANSNTQCNQQLVDTELFTVASKNSLKLLKEFSFTTLYL